MINNNTIKDVQNRILEIIYFIDGVCRKNNIIYYIMGGTALGAIRHNGFIPWDDDLDIFMTPENYEKFKNVFNNIKEEKYVLQEWKIVESNLEYAKVRMNGTTFIETSFKNRKDMHHGIYVDIMILHKCPKNRLIQKIIYYESKYVTLLALLQRNWKPKTKLDKVIVLASKFMPNKIISTQCYKDIYRYDCMTDDFDYCYFITKARFNQGVFAREMFEQPKDVTFEGMVLMAPSDIKGYLRIRFGDYMKLPTIEQQKADIHACIYDTEVTYEKYICSDI